MEQITIETGGRRKTHYWRAEVPTYVKPEIISTVEENGVEYYVCSEGKRYVKKAFDEMFGRKKVVAIKPRHKSKDLDCKGRKRRRAA